MYAYSTAAAGSRRARGRVRRGSCVTALHPNPYPALSSSPLNPHRNLGQRPCRVLTTQKDFKKIGNEAGMCLKTNDTFNLGGYSAGVNRHWPGNRPVSCAFRLCRLSRIWDANKPNRRLAGLRAFFTAGDRIIGESSEDEGPGKSARKPPSEVRSRPRMDMPRTFQSLHQLPSGSAGRWR